MNWTVETLNATVDKELSSEIHLALQRAGEVLK